jgi:hypothetical protein
MVDLELRSIMHSREPEYVLMLHFANSRLRGDDIH